MTPTATPEDIEHKLSAKRSAALVSVLAALVITALKILTGVLTGSLGMLSEGAHSSVDLVAAAITFFSIRVSDRPADEDHNYGHGKIESLAAFFETVLMLGSCVWILTEAIRRIFFHERFSLTFSIWPFAVLLLSITVDFTRSRNLHRVAQQYNSEALEADAIHFSTDIWSSLAVLFGLVATFVGARMEYSRAGTGRSFCRDYCLRYHPACDVAAGTAHYRYAYRCQPLRGAYPNKRHWCVSWRRSTAFYRLTVSALVALGRAILPMSRWACHAILLFSVPSRSPWLLLLRCSVICRGLMLSFTPSLRLR